MTVQDACPQQGLEARALARAFLKGAEAVLHLESLAEGWPLDEPAPTGPGCGAELARRAASCDWSWWPPTALADFLLSPLSGLEPTDAWRLDAQWRGDRSLSPARVLARLAAVARSRGDGALASAVACLQKGRVGTAAQRLAENPALAPEARDALALVADAARRLAARSVTLMTAGPAGLIRAFEEELGEAQVVTALPVWSERGAAPACPPSPSLARALRGYLVPPQPGTATGTLSASQIESYLECPGKWLTLRRLKLGGVDAGFSPVEVGSFSHRVLELWGRGLWGAPDDVAGVLETENGPAPEPAGGLPLDPQATEASAAWLDRCFDAHLAHQVMSGHRLQDQALTPHDAEELASLEGRVHADVRRAAAFVAEEFRALRPSGFEVRFGRDEEGNAPIYAGVPVVGSADLVLSGAGTSVVVDYKHRDDAAEEYREDGGRPRHIQALLYATVLGRTNPEPAPGAALFLGIGDPCVVAGVAAEEARALLPEQGSVAWSNDFSDTLAATEGAVAHAMAALMAGDVAPNPRDAEACRYCPALTCPSRLGPQPPHIGDPAALLLPLVAMLAQPADTRVGLYPLLAGPLFGLDDNDLLLLATGTCPETGLPQARRLDRGIRAGLEGLPAGAQPSGRLRRAMDVLGTALASVNARPLASIVAQILGRSLWRPAPSEADRIAQALGFLAARERAGHGPATAPAALATELGLSKPQF